MFHSPVQLRHMLALLLVLGLATALRVYRLSASGLRTDEYFSLECSSGWGRSDLRLKESETAPDLVSLNRARPWYSIWSSMAKDENHPPLYFVVLRAWRSLFNDSEISLRSLSIAASLVSIMLLFCIGATSIGPYPALWACALMAVTWPQIEQAQQERAYSLLTTIGLVSLLAIVRIERNGVSLTRVLMLYCAALFMPLLHYMAFPSLCALAIYAALMMRGNLRTTVLGCLLAAGLMYAAVWGTQLIGQHRNMVEATEWMTVDAPQTFQSIVEHFAILPARFVIEPRRLGMPLAVTSVSALIIPLLLVRRFPRVLLWWLWLAVPIFFALFLDLLFNRKSLDFVKYTLVAAPGLYLMIGSLAGASRLSVPRLIYRICTIAPAVIIASCLLCVGDLYTLGQPDWRALSRFVRMNTDANTPIFIISNQPERTGTCVMSLTYYLADENHRIYFVDHAPGAEFFASLGNTSEVCFISDQRSMAAIALPWGAKVEHRDLIFPIAVACEVKLSTPVLAARHLSANTDLVNLTN